MAKFPDISISPPSLANSQYSFGGVLLGASQAWSVQEADGLDLTKVRSNDTPRPLDSGEFEGIDLLSGRDITLTLHSLSTSDTALRSVLSSLESVMVPPLDGVSETPLWWQRSGNPLLCCMVRPRQLRLKSNRKLTSIHVAQPICLMHASSAFVYGPTQSSTLQVPGVGAGAKFNWTFNLSFGGGGSVGIVTIDNTGTAYARPVYIFTGPINTPTVQIPASPGNPYQTYDLVMAAGDVMVVDTDLDGPSVTYYSASSPQLGSSRLSAIAPGSTPDLWLPPGSNEVAFSSQDSAPTAGTLEIVWAPTFTVGL